MPAIFQDKFYGGVTKIPRTGIREGDAGVFVNSLVHFNEQNRLDRLTPYRSSEAVENKDLRIRRMLLASNGTFYGYGVTPSTGIPEIYKADGAFPYTGWTIPSLNNKATSGVANFDAFIEYKNYLYGYKGGTNIWRFGDITSSPTFTENWQSQTYASVAQPVIHPEDDILYFFHDNKVATYNGSAYSAGIEIPATEKIVSCVAYDRFIAIGASPKESYSGNSKIYLWNRDTSSTYFSAVVNLGRVPLKMLGIVENKLVAVLLDGSSTKTVGTEKLLVQVYSGGFAREEASFEATAVDVTAPPANFKSEMIFGGGYTSEGIQTFGTWKIAQNILGEIALSFDTVEEDVTISTAVNGIQVTGDYTWIAHSSDGSINRTNDQAIFTYTSIVETRIFTGGDPFLDKYLESFKVFTTPLPLNAQVVVKYRIDHNTAWTILGTHNTQNSVSDMFSVNAVGENVNFKEIQFRIESTGGATLTGYKFHYEFDNTQ